MSLDNNGWDSLRNEHSPRIWLIMEDNSYLLRWEDIELITASADYLTLKLDCRMGQVVITSAGSLQRLFEELQLEWVRLIDGRKLKVKVHFLNPS